MAAWRACACPPYEQVLSAHPFHGINRKVQLKPVEWEEQPPFAQAPDGVAQASPIPQRLKPSPQRRPTALKFVLKWGGELTALGEAQATNLGTRFRKTLYPGEVDGVLRLHATYRHDLKIYSSDEGRVQMTAAAFAKGFLDLDGQLTPILASLVSKDDSVTRMLDETPEVGRVSMNRAKAAIHSILTSEFRLSDAELEQRSSPEPPPEPAAELPAEPSEANTPVRLVAKRRDDMMELEQLPPSTLGSLKSPQAPCSPQPTCAMEPSASQETAALPTPPPPAQSPVRPTELPACPPAAARAAALVPSSEPQSPQVPPTPPSTPLVPPTPHLGNSLAHGGDDATAVLELPPAGPERPPLLTEAMPAMLVSPLLRAIQRLDEASNAEEVLLIGTASRDSLINPRDALMRLVHLLDDLCTELSARLRRDGLLANGETPLLQYNRWNKLKREFYQPSTGVFDTTKIPVCARFGACTLLALRPPCTPRTSLALPAMPPTHSHGLETCCRISTTMPCTT